jgi:prepilin-type processing-associated H-X9-DG protein
MNHCSWRQCAWRHAVLSKQVTVRRQCSDRELMANLLFFDGHTLAGRPNSSRSPLALPSAPAWSHDSCSASLMPHCLADWSLLVRPSACTHGFKSRQHWWWASSPMLAHDRECCALLSWLFVTISFIFFFFFVFMCRVKQCLFGISSRLFFFLFVSSIKSSLARHALA